MVLFLQWKKQMHNQYIIQFQKKQKKEKQRFESKRQSIISLFPHISNALKQINAKRILVYGSILRPKSFHHKSDLDILVYGLDIDKWFKAYKIVEQITSNIDISIDVHLSQEMDQVFLSSVEEYGLII